MVVCISNAPKQLSSNVQRTKLSNNLSATYSETYSKTHHLNHGRLPAHRSPQLLRRIQHLTRQGPRGQVRLRRSRRHVAHQGHRRLAGADQGDQGEEG